MQVKFCHFPLDFPPHPIPHSYQHTSLPHFMDSPLSVVYVIRSSLGCRFKYAPQNVTSCVLQVSGSLSVALSEFCSRLATHQVLSLVSRVVNAAVPPTLHALSQDHTSLALQYPCGLQVSARL